MFGLRLATKHSQESAYLRRVEVGAPFLAPSHYIRRASSHHNERAAQHRGRGEGIWSVLDFTSSEVSYLSNFQGSTSADFSTDQTLTDLRLGKCGSNNRSKALMLNDRLSNTSKGAKR